MRFAESAWRLAGFTGAYFGWSPDHFWRATPTELAAIAVALTGDDSAAPPDAATLARLKEIFPDG